MLHRHKVHAPSAEDGELDESLMEEMDSMDAAPDDDAPSDPRWDALKGLASQGGGDDND